jgi:hypothetical protein
MNIILPGESGVSKYDDDPNAPLYIEDKDIEMTKDEKKHWLAGDDVPVIQATNPWSMQVDDTNVDKDFHKQTLEMPQQPANQILTLGKADFNQNISNLTSILQDILAGDAEAMKRPEFNALNFPAIKAYLEWAIKTNRLSDLAKCDLMSNAWRLNFKCRPPTPEEFLTEKFIGAQAEALHPWLRDTFVEFFDPLKPYRTLILTQHIGSGKSTMTVLLQLYISVHYAMMWHPYRFFGMAMSSIFTQCLGGWNQKKASELLLEPFTQILEGAPYFQRVKTHQNLVEASAGEIDDCIHWTTSAQTSALSMQNGVNYKIINGPGSILGQNIISAAISELTMFSENGWSDEKIFTFFTKLRKRIDSRMKGNYYGRFVIDSQPNSLESPIDEWIWADGTRKNKSNLIISGSRWKYFPKEFPDAWETPRTDWKQPECLKKDFIHAFPVFKGGDGQPPKVIETAAELSTYNSVDVEWAPTNQITSSGIVSMKDNAEESPINFLRDQCGIPSGAADRLLYNKEWIDHTFDNNLKNIYSTIIAKTEDEPEHLIWNQVKDKFFNKILGKYYFYYEPSLPRSASIDLAISGDTAAIAISHVERDPVRLDTQGQPLKVYITDMVVPVIPKGGMINLDAFKFFILDLIRLGNMNIRHVSFDSFQSRAMMQSLERAGIEVDYISVDKNNAPYLSLIDYVMHKRYYCGKSVMVKNNLLSLQMVKRKSGTAKIDHMNGENVYTDEFCMPGSVYSEQSWQFSKVGTSAKDVTDAIAGTLYLLDTYENEYIPFHVWDPLKEKERTYEGELKKQQAMLSKMGLC